MTKQVQISLLVLRLVLGLTFLIHGVVKFQSGLGNIAGFFESVGVPGFMAYAVAVVELVGGIALIVGLGTRIVSGLIALIMVGAIFKVKLAGGFLGTPQMAGYELDLALLAMAVALGISGSKLYALEQIFRPADKGSLS